MILKTALFSVISNKFNYIFRMLLYLKQRVYKLDFKFILDFLNKINTFYFLNRIKSFISYNYLYKKKNNYIQDSINININYYFNRFFKKTDKLIIDSTNSKKSKNSLLFISHLASTPVYLENSVNSPTLVNTSFLKEFFRFINKINKNDSILIETRVRNNIYIGLNYNISLNSYFDFFTMEMCDIMILTKYLSIEDNLKVASVHHLLLSLIDNNVFSDNILFIKSELILTNIKKLIKNEKIKVKAKNFSHLSLINLIILYFNKLYFDIKVFLIGNRNLIRETFISRDIKMLFQYLVKLNNYIFKTKYLLPEHLFFILFNVKNLKISKIFLNLLNNNLKKNVTKVNSFIYSKNSLDNNQSFVNRNQEYYLFLLKRATTEYKIKIFLNSIYRKSILNYFRFLILNNILNKFTSKDTYKNFIEDILIININRY